MAASIYDEASLNEVAAKEPTEQPYLRALLDVPHVFSKQWRQTSIVDPPQIEDEILRTRLAKVLIWHHRGIRLNPYNPKMWIDRGRHFIELGYGELAVSDAYKARLLLDSFLGISDTNAAHSDLDKDSLQCKVSAALAGFVGKPDTGAARGYDAGVLFSAKFLQQQAFLVMASALIYLRGYHDAIQVLDEAIVLCGTSEELQRLSLQAKEKFGSLEQSPHDHIPGYGIQSTKQGGVKRVAYPWISPEELGRGKKAVKRVKSKFETASMNATLGLSSVGGTTSDSLGVFARQNISRHDLIVIDKSAFTVFNVQGNENCWACSRPLGRGVVSMTCCKAKFCSESCKAEAINTYHQVLCGKDFKWLYEASKDAEELSCDMIPLLLMKILATAVQQNARPLKVACVGTLKINYNDDNPRYSIFKLHDNVVAPLKILQTLGVDVFKDMRFDSWALQTLIHRIENNMNYTKKGEVIYSAICPLFCMFNHDCDPSADWNTYHQDKHQGGPVFVIATRDIKKGEEISVSYIVDIPLETDRRPRLVAQIGCMCGCARCDKERKETLEKERNDSLEKEALMQFAERLPDFELFRVNNGISNEEGNARDETLRRLRILRARYPSL